MTRHSLRRMEWLRRLAMIRTFSEEVGRRCRRGERCRPVIRVTDGTVPSGMLGWIDGAADTLVRGIEFRRERE